MAVASRLNPQTRFGDDVLSRILHARENPDGLRQLQEAVAAAVDEMIGQLCQQAGVPRERIYESTVAGNTTMQQLLCGIDPRPLGEVPFVPAVGRGLALPAARSWGCTSIPAAAATCMPVIGGFVGGDTVAGILATGLADAASPRCLVDIGTNGEIVLLADGQADGGLDRGRPGLRGRPDLAACGQHRRDREGRRRRPARAST